MNWVVLVYRIPGPRRQWGAAYRVDLLMSTGSGGVARSTGDRDLTVSLVLSAKEETGGSLPSSVENIWPPRNDSQGFSSQRTEAGLLAAAEFVYRGLPRC